MVDVADEAHLWDELCFFFERAMGLGMFPDQKMGTSALPFYRL